MDVVFQSAWPQHAPYLDAVRNLVPPAVTDSAVARVLRAKAAIGLFADPYGNPDSAAYWNGHPTHRALAREAAAAAMVLLRNTGVLPLNANISSVALIGTDAAEARLGGYTAPGAAPVSILAGLTARLGNRVHYVSGPGRESAAYAAVPAGRLALTAEFFANPDLAGAPKAVRRDSAVDVRWSFAPPAPGLGTDWYSVRWSGTLTAGPVRVTRLGVDGTDGWRLWLDGRLLIDAWEKRTAGARLVSVTLAPGSTHAFRLEFHETTGNAQFRLVWDTGAEQAALARLDSAVALARRSAVAVVVAGIEEGEFRDRARLGLPGYQEELIRRVAATGTPTVVVLVGGSAVTMPWLDSVGAVLMAWYPGEAGGHAVADVLLGSVSPSGRLPISFPLEEGQLPLTYNHRPTGRGDDYADLSGRPLFPFGFGLSYTRFTYDSLVIVPAAIAPEGSAEVRLRVRNSGDARGARGGPALPTGRTGHLCPAGAAARGVHAGVARAGRVARGALPARAGTAGGARRRTPPGGGAGQLHDLRGGVVARHPPPRHARGPLMRRRDFLATGAAGAAAMAAPGFGRLVAGPARPVPTPQQLQWQRDELALFLHFGVNTFTDREWGDGTEDPAIFQPTALDARQWARAAKSAGARGLVLTAKHHDGFCLWPTATTTHSVASSPWRGGGGDVVREFADACRAEGLWAGLYLSPWDRNAPSYGDSPRYNDFYCAQLTELLTRYGPLNEVWFDGAVEVGPGGRKQEYDWARIWGLVRALQPGAVIFSDAGPDVRWIGNERGVAGDPNWSPVNPATVPYPGASGDDVIAMLQHGDPSGTVWRPGEADVSIRPGWFWHPAEDEAVRTVDDLVELHFSSVGRNAKLLLNVPPTREGVIHPTDATRLQGMRERLDALFAEDRFPDAAAGRPVTVSTADLREDIARGQSVAAYRLEGRVEGAWRVLSRGTTIGHRKLDRFAPVTITGARLIVEDAVGPVGTVPVRLFT